jgi:hypothetical protein
MFGITKAPQNCSVGRRLFACPPILRRYWDGSARVNESRLPTLPGFYAQYNQPNWENTLTHLGDGKMKTLTLKIDDAVSDKFTWLLEHFAPEEIKILEQGEYVDDDAYLRTIDGMVPSIQEARVESLAKGVTLDKLEW